MQRLAVDMTKWRNIDYERRFKRELDTLNRSGNSQNGADIPGSKHLKRHAKLIDADADKKFPRKLGLISEKDAKPEVKKLQPVKCAICGEFNEPFRRCWKCKAVLDLHDENRESLMTVKLLAKSILNSK